jgi:phage FluMu protein Com
MEKKKLSIKQGDTRIETKCGKCGTLNKVSAAPGETRVEYACKDCGHKQKTI